MMAFSIYGKIKNVPNHQPEYVTILMALQYLGKLIRICHSLERPQGSYKGRIPRMFDPIIYGEGEHWGFWICLAVTSWPCLPCISHPPSKWMIPPSQKPPFTWDFPDMWVPGWVIFATWTCEKMWEMMWEFQRSEIHIVDTEYHGSNDFSRKQTMTPQM